MLIKMRALRPDLPPAPCYATEFAAGLDLCADRVVVLMPFERVLVATGYAIELPVGYEGQVRPRSGLAFKRGITVLNSPGTIDSDYRGEIKVMLYNSDPVKMVTIERGDRVAQLVIAPVSRVEIELVDALSETHRGEGGFGSTGR